MIIAPHFNGIFTLEEHERLRRSLGAFVYEICVYQPKNECIEINLNFLRSQQEIHTYFQEIFMWAVKNTFQDLEKHGYGEVIKHRELYISSKSKEKIKWAQYSIYNTLMEKCDIKTISYADCGIFTNNTIYKLRITKHI